MAESRVEILTPEEGEKLRRRIRELESELADLRAAQSSKLARARQGADAGVTDPGSGYARVNQYKQIAELLDATADAIISIDKSGAISRFNRGAETIFGYRSSEIIGRPLDVLMPERFRRSHRSHMANFGRAEDRSRLMNERGEIFGLRKNGDEFPAEASIVRLESGARRIFTVILRDITERKAAETALREREAQLRLAQEMARIGSFVWDETTDCGDYCSVELAAILGATPANLLGNGAPPGWLLERVHPDDRERYVNAVSDARERAVAYDIEFQFLKPEGDLVHLREMGEPETDPEGKVVRIFGTVQDITQIRQAEDTLRRSEALLSQAQRLARLGVYVWDNVTNICVYCSEDMAALFGVSPSEFISEFGTEDGYLAAVHEDDRKRVRSAMSRAMTGAEPYEIEYRIRTHDGEWRHFREITEPVRDSAGRNIRTFGTVQDITSLRQAETARQRSEEQFRDLIEGSIQGVLIHRDFKPIFANRAIADIYGYEDAQEILALGSLHPLIAPEEREKLQAIKKARMENREAPAQYEFRGIRKDGSEIWLENRGNVVRWDGEPAILSVMVDVTDRHEAQTALEERERQLRTITDNLPAFIAYTDRQSRLRFANRTVEKWYGDDRERLLGKDAMELLGREEGKRIQARTKEILAGKTVRSEERRTFPDGSTRYVDNTSIPNIAADGQVKGWFSLITDITERKVAEEAIRHREEQLRAITDNIPAFIVYIDSDLRYRFANRVAEQWYNRPASVLTSRKVEEVVGQEAFEMLHPKLKSVLEGKPMRSEEVLVFPDGSQRHVDMSYVPDVSEDGQVRGFFALLLDISGRRQAEDALRRSVRASDLLRQIATAANEAASAEQAMSHCLETIGRYGGWDIASVFVVADDDSGEMLPTELWWAEDPGSFGDFRRSTEKIGFAPGKGLPGRIAATGKPAWIENVRMDDNFPRARMRGRLDVTSGFGFPVMVGQRVAAVLEFFSRDLRVRDEDLVDVATQAGTILGRVVERQRAEWSRQDREERIRLMADNVPVLITYIQPDKTFGFVNRTTEEWYGRPAAELTNCPLHELIGDASFKKMEPQIDRSLAGETLHFEEVLSYPDGRTRHIDATYVPHVGERGEIRGVFTMVVDITDRIQAEVRLRQSQRMEAIGKLTGGIAHDFNNLLAVILGNAEIVCDRLGETEPAVKAITGAANRGAELTRRLLAFSRQQPLRPEPTDLGKLTSEMSQILSRTLGEAVAITVRRRRNVWAARVDPQELGNAILNLAINARDAMPSGGTLTLEPSNVTLNKRKAAQFENAAPGDYVRLAVSDSGDGMPVDVVEHAFEPFFTTKAFGTGSGLGLSMVYGFTIQSGGFATIESTVGEGTTVNLYFPRAEAVDGADQAGRGPCAPIKGGETILVVEDDPDVRKLTVTLLSSMGYHVLEAEDGEAALSALAKAREIDLLLSDVVLPGDMSGPAIAELATEKSPSLPVLFMSGYAEDVIRRDREGKSRTVDAEVLTKPFTRGQLAEKVGAALGTKVR